MTHILVPIVEGHGEVAALPLLIRRMAEAYDVYDISIPTPIRVPKSKIIRHSDKTKKVEIEPHELARAIELAGAKVTTSGTGSVLILFDADKFCPADIGPRLQREAEKIRSDVMIRVVLAKREIESWLLASIASLRGKRSIKQNACPPDNPEEISDAKGCLESLMTDGATYSERIDLPALLSQFDMKLAEKCDSFVKFKKEIGSIFDSFKK